MREAESVRPWGGGTVKKYPFKQNKQDGDAVG